MQKIILHFLVMLVIASIGYGVDVVKVGEGQDCEPLYCHTDEDETIFKDIKEFDRFLK